MVNPAVALNIMHVYTLIFHPKVVFYCGTEWYRFYGMGVLYCYRRFLTVICLIIPPSSSRPARHAGGAREVFDGGLPCCSVCVFAFNYFSSRFSWLHSQAVQRCGIVFWGVASSTHVLVTSGTVISPNFPYFCVCGSSGWASVIVRPWKAGNYLRNR